MNKVIKNPTLLLTLSAAFEYYDFIIYGLMSSYLGVLFFPSDDLFVGQLKAFSVFALGYIARPLGGMIFGILGDLGSRRAIFIRSNIILSIATIIISILPNYNQIGVMATVGLVVLRIIQSLTFAAELPGAMSLIKDTVKEPSKSFSFVVSGAAIGSILGSFTLYLLERIFNKQEILDFAWRFPFILGAILCLIAIILRRNLPEKPQNNVKDKLGLLSIIFPQYKNIVTFVTIISLSAYLIIMNIFFPSFLPEFYKYEIKDVYLAISISLIWAVIYAPSFAYFSNKIDKITLLRVVIVMAIFLALVINFILLRKGFSNLLIGLCIYQSIITSLMVITFPLMAEIFPSQARFTLIAVCYNITYLIMSFSPMLVTKLASYWQSPFSLWFGLILLSIFALANMANLVAKPYQE